MAGAAEKAGGAIWALGAMSGTSLDGVDAAMVLSDGHRVLEFGPHDYRPYTEREREILRAGLGAGAGSPEALAAGEVVEQAHGELLSGFEGAALIGFHGQTLSHRPGEGWTLQAGDGQVLAELLGIPVVWDFRSADMELGGQGAPLAPFFHHALGRRIGASAPIAFVNIGGVANLTWLDPVIGDPAAPGACLAFDCGPGNAPLDDFLRARRGEAMDRDGSLAASGRVDETVLARLTGHGFFHKIPPKSLDRDDFAFLAEAVAGLSDADGAATLTACIAAGIALAFEHCPARPGQVLITGGGRRNPVLMAMLAAGLDCKLAPVEEAGLDGDMLEAQAFAHLAVRVARGLPTSAPGTTGVGAPVGGGRLSRPTGLR